MGHIPDTWPRDFPYNSDAAHGVSHHPPSKTRTMMWVTVGSHVLLAEMRNGEHSGVLRNLNCALRLVRDQVLVEPTHNPGYELRSGRFGMLNNGARCEATVSSSSSAVL